MSIKKIAIYGIGLIGGSVALSAKKHIRDVKIIAVDSDSSSLDFAYKKKIADEILQDTENLYSLSSCDIIVVATPVDLIAGTVIKILPNISKNSLITDTGSVKGAIIKNITKKAGKKAPFIGSHPIAGTENSGIKSADEKILEGENVILTPTKESSEKNIRKLKHFWKSIGMNPLVVSSTGHDKAVAHTSHFPHIIAYLLVNAVSGKKIHGNTLEAFTGPGFHDLTRIAKSNPDLWAEITMLNKREILKASGEFKNRLNKIEELIKSARNEELKKIFLKSQLTKKKISKKD